MTQRWVPRDQMVAVTVKRFLPDGTDERIPLRFSAEGYEKFRELVEPFVWKNELRDVTPERVPS